MDGFTVGMGDGGWLTPTLGIATHWWRRKKEQQREHVHIVTGWREAVEDV